MRLFAAAFCLTATMYAQPANQKLHALFDEYHEAYLRQNPEEATSLGRNEYNDR